MRLAAARARPVTLRFVRPVRTARGEFVERRSVILELRDADGAVGYGEAAPWPGFGTEPVEQSLEILTELERSLVGAEVDLDRALEAGDGHQWLAAGRDAVQRFAGRRDEGAALQVVRLLAQAGDLAAKLEAAPAARAALEGALWDLAARRAGQPLAAFLAEGRRAQPPADVFEAACRSAADPLDRPVAAPGTRHALTHVAASALFVTTAPDAVREEAVSIREAGYRGAKLKLGTATLAQDVARVAAAREGLGPDVELRGDANGAWSERQAREALEALAEFGLSYVEQPLEAEAIDGLARLRRDSPVRIAADESAATESGVARLLAAHAVDVIVLKPAALGGPAQALALAGLARRVGCQVVFTHAFESAVGARHVLHCAAAWGDAATAHGVGTVGLFERDVAEPVVVRAGFADVSFDTHLAQVSLGTGRADVPRATGRADVSPSAGLGIHL